jgi:recombination protein RecT
MSNNKLPAIRNYLTAENVKSSIETRIGNKTGVFITSLLDLCGDDKSLQDCDPGLIMKEGLKAAALDLPINKNLGFAYVIPYKNIPSFQMGWKGYVQLAIRTGQYRHLNPGIVYEGEEMIVDRIRGTLEIGGKKTSEKPIGYYCYMELLNGFQKAVAWTKEQVEAHALKFSSSYSYYKKNPKGRKPVWVTDFDAMALKTMVLQLITKFGPMTVEMSTAMSNDRADFKGFDDRMSEEIEDNANSEIIDIPADDDPPGEDGMTEDEKAEIMANEAVEAEKGPGF